MDVLPYNLLTQYILDKYSLGYNLYYMMYIGSRRISYYSDDQLKQANRQLNLTKSCSTKVLFKMRTVGAHFVFLHACANRSNQSGFVIRYNLFSQISADTKNNDNLESELKYQHDQRTSATVPIFL